MTTTERNEAIDKAILILRQEMKEAKQNMYGSIPGNMSFFEAIDTEKDCKRAVKTLNRIKSKA